MKRVFVVACVFGALGFAMPARADTPTWIDDAPLVVATDGNEAGVALPDGRALVMGGVSSNGAEASAQVYDPATSTWKLVAPMHQARWYPKAVDLPGNRVLVLGLGDYQAEGNGTYEVFDAAAGTWSESKVGPATSWEGQLAVLADGTPLYLDTANSQRYDAATDNWSPIPVPWDSTSRHIAFAVLLHGGTLLVLVQADTPTAYIYDPVADAWHAAGQPSVVGSGFTSAALAPDGRVVALYSTISSPSSGGVIFDPISESWSPVAVPFDGLVYTRLGNTPSGSVLAVGGEKWEAIEGCGSCFSVEAQTSTWSFDSQTDAWNVEADMHHGRTAPVLLTLPSGTLAVFGYYRYPNIGSSERFGAPMPPPPPPPPPIKASINDAQVTEGGPGISAMTFTVTLDTPARDDLHLRLDTIKGTAKSPGDYVAGPIDFTIPKGATSGTVSVTVRGDTDPEAKETFKVIVSGGDLDYTDSEGVGTIIDDDFGLCASLPVNGRTCIGFQNPG